MQKEFQKAYDLLEKGHLFTLDLPEDKNFIQHTKKFQEQIKELEQKLKVDGRLIKNVYFISSELLQAVIHNGVFRKEIFINNVKIANFDNKFFLLSQNLVNNESISRIQLKFDEVNGAFDAEDTHAELQLRYDYKMKKKSGAKGMVSVGVLDLARRSLNKILYNFDKIDDDHSVFSIICTVNAI